MTVGERLAALPVVGTALAVQRRYTRDAADPLAAAIGFFAFVSLVPLLLLAVSVAGYVWDDPERQLEVAEAITGALPGLEATLDEGEATPGATSFVEGIVARRGTIGLVGLVLLLPTGLKVVAAAMTATRVVFRGEPLTGVAARVRQLVALVGLGALALTAAAASSLVGTLTGVLPTPLPTLVALVATFALDLLLFTAAYRLLSPSGMTVRQLLPGAVLGAAGWTLLKVAGAAYVSSQVDSANALYGALGGVVALLLLLYLAGRLYLYGAELSAVLAERAPDPGAGRAARAAASARAGTSVTPPATSAGAASLSARSTSPVPRVSGRAGAARRAGARAAARQEASGDGRTAVALGLTGAALLVVWRLLGRREA